MSTSCISLLGVLEVNLSLRNITQDNRYKIIQDCVEFSHQNKVTTLVDNTRNNGLKTLDAIKGHDLDAGQSFALVGQPAILRISEDTIEVSDNDGKVWTSVKLSGQIQPYLKPSNFRWRIALPNLT